MEPLTEINNFHGWHGACIWAATASLLTVKTIWLRMRSNSCQSDTTEKGSTMNSLSKTSKILLTAGLLSLVLGGCERRSPTDQPDTSGSSSGSSGMSGGTSGGSSGMSGGTSGDTSGSSGSSGGTSTYGSGSTGTSGGSDSPTSGTSTR